MHHGTVLVLCGGCPRTFAIPVADLARPGEGDGWTRLAHGWARLCFTCTQRRKAAKRAETAAHHAAILAGAHDLAVMARARALGWTPPPTADDLEHMARSLNPQEQPA